MPAVFYIFIGSVNIIERKCSQRSELLDGRPRLIQISYLCNAIAESLSNKQRAFYWRLDRGFPFYTVNCKQPKDSQNNSQNEQPIATDNIRQLTAKSGC